MKMLKIALAACAGALALSGTASAQGFFNFEPTDGYIYVAGSVGVAVPDDIGAAELDTDLNYGGALGARLPFKSFGIIHTRIEAEVNYFEADVTVPGLAEGSLDNLFVFANSYADFIWRDDQALIPYLGGGLGIAITDTDGVDSVTNFATHNAIGLTFPVNKLDLYTEARYFKIYADGPNLDGFTFTGGLRYKF